VQKEPRELMAAKVAQVGSHRRLETAVRRRVLGLLPSFGNRTVVRVYSEASSPEELTKLSAAAKTMDLRIKRPEIRIMPQAQRVRSALVERAPQAEAFGRRVVNQIGSSGQPIAREISEKLRPALAWLYSARRRLATIAVGVVTVWLFVHVMFGANGMVVYRKSEPSTRT